MIVSQAIRDSAEGEDCTVRFPGYCNFNPETTVLAHLDDESHGLALKSDDISSCYACSCCHDVLDGRIKHQISEDYMEQAKRRAMVRTWRRMVEKGVITIKGYAP